MEPEPEVEAMTEHEPEIDPLDAQALGLHERDYELGHEEIKLNLDAVDAPNHSERPPHETPRGG